MTTINFTHGDSPYTATIKDNYALNIYDSNGNHVLALFAHGIGWAATINVDSTLLRMLMAAYSKGADDGISIGYSTAQADIRKAIGVEPQS